MSENEKDFVTDVVELCALLQCLGFSVRSLDTSDVNLSQEAGGGCRTVVINCQSSGIHVVLESGDAGCSCPVTSLEASGTWQVSAVSGGKRHDKEFGSSLLGNLPKPFTEQLSKELRDLVRSVREKHELDDAFVTEKKSYKQEESQSQDVLSRSASLIEMKVTPEKRDIVKVDTPTRYRSLGCLNDPKDEFVLPAPRPLNKITDDLAAENAALGRNNMCKRQSTYTISTPGSSQRRNKTSSPIQSRPYNMLERLINAEKTAEDLHNMLADIVREFRIEDKTSSMSSLALDVSKISLLKVNEPLTSQFVSSPNLSTPGTGKDDLSKSKLKRFDSASTSNLSGRKITPNKESGTKLSKLKKLSPSCFHTKKEYNIGNSSKTPQNDSKCSKFNSLLKAKITKPVRTGSKQGVDSESSQGQGNISAYRNKYSHIKSTIPRPTPTKKF